MRTTIAFAILALVIPGVISGQQRYYPYDVGDGEFDVYHHRDAVRAFERQQELNRDELFWHSLSLRRELRNIRNSIDDLAFQQSVNPAPIPLSPHSAPMATSSPSQKVKWDYQVSKARQREEASHNGVDTRSSADAWLDQNILKIEEENRAKLEFAEQMAAEDAAEQAVDPRKARAMRLRDMRRQRLGQ